MTSTGHGNHQYVARLATEAFNVAADASVYPRTLKLKGASLFQPLKLYYGLGFVSGFTG